MLSCAVAVTLLGGAPEPRESSRVAADGSLEVCRPMPVDPASWVVANVDATTLTWDGLANFTPDERRIIEAGVGRSTRARLWREHLSNAANQSRFGPEQRALIERVRGWYKDSGAPVPAEVAITEEEVRRAFEREDIRSVFRLLGPVAQAPDRPTPEQLDEGILCRCLDAPGECPEGKSCLRVWCFPWPGCGPLNQFWCRGKCYSVS